MYSIVDDIIRIIKATDGIEWVRIISLFRDIIILTLSIICTKWCNSVNVSFITNKKISIIVTIILPSWAILFNTIHLKRIISDSPKTCNKCGTVTKTKYPVCFNCKTENDFTCSVSNLSELTAIYKMKLLPALIFTVVFILAVALFNSIIIYLGV